MKKGGFTLIELMVAMAVFSFVIASVSGLFVYSLRAQRRSIAYQQLLDQTSYAAEYMSRAIRMAKKDLLGSCLTTVGAKYNYETNLTRDRIRFLNYQNQCQEFFLEESQLKERRSTNSSAANFQTPQDLTSSDLMAVFVIGSSSSWDQSDDEQPKVIMSLSIIGKENSKVNIQTTISQRNLDVRR